MCEASQTLVTTKQEDDSAECVLVPVERHKDKERRDYGEPIGKGGYDLGTEGLFNACDTVIFTSVNDMTDDVRENVYPQINNEGYSACHQHKTTELDRKYPDCTECDKHVILHTRLAGAVNEVNLRAVVAQ